jgi:hypothetical protein
MLKAALTAEVLLKEEKIGLDVAVAAIKLSQQGHQSMEHSVFDLGIRNICEKVGRIGDLLTGAGLLTEGDKFNALEIALNSKKSIGEVLLENNMVTSRTLTVALKLQELAHADFLSLHQIVAMLKNSDSLDFSLEAAVAGITQKGKEANQVEQTIDLLLKTNLLSPQDIEESRAAAEKTRQSLGQVLLSTNKIDQSYLPAIWQAQKLIDNQIISAELAATTLHSMRDSSLSFYQALDKIIKDSEKSTEKNNSPASTLRQLEFSGESVFPKADDGNWLRKTINKLKNIKKPS